MTSVLIVAGVVILIILSKKRRRPARTGSTRTATTRTVKTVYAPGTKKPTDAEKLEREKQRDADRIRKEQFKRMQADADLIHYTQVKKDLLQAYDASGAVYGNTEKAIRKRIAYDNAIRRTEKQIEKAAYNAMRTG